MFGLGLDCGSIDELAGTELGDTIDELGDSELSGCELDGAGPLDGGVGEEVAEDSCTEEEICGGNEELDARFDDAVGLEELGHDPTDVVAVTVLVTNCLRI